MSIVYFYNFVVCRHRWQGRRGYVYAYRSEQYGAWVDGRLDDKEEEEGLIMMDVVFDGSV